MEELGLNDPRIQDEVILDKRVEFKTKGNVHLSRFTHYLERLAYLQEQMKGWRPRRFVELFTPGYYDRFTWFMAIFGLVFGTIAALNLAISIGQLVFAVLAWKVSAPVL